MLSICTDCHIGHTLFRTKERHLAFSHRVDLQGVGRTGPNILQEYGIANGKDHVQALGPRRSVTVVSACPVTKRQMD